MMLTEETSVPDGALPVEPFKAHLRLGTGFGEEGLQDEVLRGFLRAAIAAIEGRTGKILIERTFTLTFNNWRSRTALVLPVAPVCAIEQVELQDPQGLANEITAETFRLVPDTQRPVLRPVGGVLPHIAEGGEVRVVFRAGMAADWGELPADLVQAVLMLATHYYEYRSDTGLGEGCMPFGVSSLIQRYRPVRIGIGGAA